MIQEQANHFITFYEGIVLHCKYMSLTYMTLHSLYNLHRADGGFDDSSGDACCLAAPDPTFRDICVCPFSDSYFLQDL
jgi:hypothetical protein